MLPEPGRPRLSASDLDDAAGLLAVVRGAVATEPTAPRSGTIRVVREAMWFLWEQPRLPRPLVQSKYPRVYPWSPAAAERAVGPYPSGGRGLVIEHLRPRRLLVVEIVEREAALSPGELTGLLRQHLTAAVITSEEDRKLTAAGLTFAMPDGDDGTEPWARYLAAGLDPSRFRALSESSRSVP